MTGQEIMVKLTPFAIAIIVALMGWITAILKQYIEVHTQNLRVKSILLKLDTVVSSAVREIMITTIDSAKQSASNGKLPSEVAAAAKAAAVDKVVCTLSCVDLAKLTELFGPDFIETKIESVVHEVKNGK
jgi:hypothetical protein